MELKKKKSVEYGGIYYFLIYLKIQKMKLYRQGDVLLIKYEPINSKNRLVINKLQDSRLKNFSRSISTADFYRHTLIYHEIYRTFLFKSFRYWEERKAYINVPVQEIKQVVRHGENNHSLQYPATFLTLLDKHKMINPFQFLHLEKPNRLLHNEHAYIDLPIGMYEIRFQMEFTSGNLHPVID